MAQTCKLETCSRVQTCKLANLLWCKLANLQSCSLMLGFHATRKLQAWGCKRVSRFFYARASLQVSKFQRLQVCKFALRSKFASLQSCGWSKFASLQVCTRSKFASWHQQQVCKFSSFGRQNLDGIRVGRSCITSSSRVSSCKARYPQHPIFNCRNLKEYIRVPGGHKRHLFPNVLVLRVQSAVFSTNWSTDAFWHQLLFNEDLKCLWRGCDAVCYRVSYRVS